MTREELNLLTLELLKNGSATLTTEDGAKVELTVVGKLKETDGMTRWGQRVTVKKTIPDGLRPDDYTELLYSNNSNNCSLLLVLPKLIVLDEWVWPYRSFFFTTKQARDEWADKR